MRQSNFCLVFSILFSFFAIVFCIFAHSGREEIAYLQKIGEIKDTSPIGEQNFFWKITGLCCDDDDNLYVVDAGWNKIFKFSSGGKYILSFGREGAGPGEFLATPRGRNLRISIGNDGNVYVMDHSAWRLSVFSRNGEFIKQFRVEPFTYDTPAVNSKGDIYLLSNSGIKVVDCYSPSFRLKASLLDIEFHLQFPYLKPLFQTDLRKITERDVLKLLTKNDDLILISNFSLRVFIFNRDNEKINEFIIKEKTLMQDFKKILNHVEEENKKIGRQTRRGGKKVESSYFIVPFTAFLDENDNICLNYLSSHKTRMIYRYKIDGTFMGTWILPNDSSPIRCSNNQGYLFGPVEQNTKVAIYSVLPSLK